MTKKISIIINALSGGGAENVGINLANSFVENGWKVDLLVLNLNDAKYFDRVSKKINLISFNVSKLRYSILPLYKYIINNKPRVILVVSYFFSILLVILRSIFRFRIKIISRNIISTLQNSKYIEKKNFLKWNFMNFLIKKFYYKVDYMINQTYEMQKEYSSVIPNSIKKSSVIYNPISKYIEDYLATDKSNEIKKNNYILCVGRLEKQKAFHYAIKAFADVSKKFPNLRLKIVGKGSLERQLKKLTVDLEIYDRVDFEGFQKNLIPYYLKAKATLLTSLFEGYPNVLIESIALGTPVVAFNCSSGPKEIIRNNENGFLVNYMDLEDLKNKLSQILSKNFSKKNLISSVEINQSYKVFKQYEKIVNLFN